MDRSGKLWRSTASKRTSASWHQETWADVSWDGHWEKNPGLYGDCPVNQRPNGLENRSLSGARKGEGRLFRGKLTADSAGRSQRALWGPISRQSSAHRPHALRVQWSLRSCQALLKTISLPFARHPCAISCPRCARHETLLEILKPLCPSL